MIIKNKDESEEVIKYVAVPIPVEDKPVPYDPTDEDTSHIGRNNISKKMDEYGTYVEAHIPKPIPAEIAPCPCDPNDKDIVDTGYDKYFTQKTKGYTEYRKAHCIEPIAVKAKLVSRIQSSKLKGKLPERSERFYSGTGKPNTCVGIVMPSNGIESRFDKAIKNNKSARKFPRSKPRPYTQAYSVSATARAPVSTREYPMVRCNFCNNILFPGKIKCHICGYDMSKKVSTKIDHNPEASHKTHHTVKWYCAECNARGTYWVKNKENLSVCPNCGNNSNSSFTAIKVAPQGQCTVAPIWDWRNS